MSIPIKVPALPHAAPEATVGHRYKELNQVVARREVIFELIVGSEIVLVEAPQAGILKYIFFFEGQSVTVGAILAELETGLPNLRWDAEQGMLILDTYRPEGVTASMNYDVRREIRNGEAKFGKGFSSSLAVPQIRNDQPGQDLGAGAEANPAQHFKSNPLLAKSSQFAGVPNPQVTSVPANPSAQAAPQNAPSLGHKLQMNPQKTPTFRPPGG